MGVAPPHPTVFFENPPHQNRCPLMGHSPPPQLKNEPSQSEIQPPSPSLKRGTLFHGMIPRKSTINNNLKPS